MENIIQLIQTLGFPIACVVACGWFIAKKDKATTEANCKREERMYQQFDKFSTSLDNFNDTLKSIDNRVGAVEKKLEN